MEHQFVVYYWTNSIDTMYLSNKGHQLASTPRQSISNITRQVAAYISSKRK